MLDDQPKVGNIVVVDAETIAKVMKVDEKSIVLHALDYPFFRLIAHDNYDTSTLKIAENTRKAIQQLILPSVVKDWSVTAWETEVEQIADYILDDIGSEFEKIEIDPNLEVVVKKYALTYAKDSEWYTDSAGQEKCIKYSIHYLDVTPETILSLCPEKERHIWTAVRKASALAHLSRDIYEKVLEEVQSNNNDFDEFGDDDYDDSDDDD